MRASLSTRAIAPFGVALVLAAATSGASARRPVRGLSAITATATNASETAECPNFEALASQALWAPAPLNQTAQWSAATTSAVASAFSVSTSTASATASDYHTLTQKAASQDSDAGSLAEQWANGADWVSSVDTTVFFNISGGDAGAFTMLNCLRHATSAGSSSSTISTFLGLLAMSPLRKYLWIPTASFFVPSDAAFNELLQSLGGSAAASNGSSFVAAANASTASALVAMHLVPDSMLSGSFDDGPRLAMTGYDAATLQYSIDGSGTYPSPVNTTLDGHVHVSQVVRKISDCSYFSTANIYQVSKVLACNGTGDACPLSKSVMSLQYRPAANSYAWAS